MATFQHRHYETIARILKDNIPGDEPDTRSLYAHICSDFSNTFKKDNPNFDPVRFLKACGYEEENRRSPL